MMKLNAKRIIPFRRELTGLDPVRGLELMRFNAPMLKASPKIRSDRLSILDRGRPVVWLVEDMRGVMFCNESLSFNMGLESWTCVSQGSNSKMNLLCP